MKLAACETDLMKDGFLNYVGFLPTSRKSLVAGISGGLIGERFAFGILLRIK
jgi:hypothetical protein